MNSPDKQEPLFYHLDALDDGQPVDQYLNPAYWNGHTIGVGPREEFEVLRRHRSEIRFASRALARYLGVERAPFAIETFGDGDIFNPDAFDPGTIVSFEVEWLLKGAGVIFEDLSNPALFEGWPVPNQPAMGEHREAGRLGTALYEANPYLGVVTPGRGGTHGLYDMAIGAYTPTTNNRRLLHKHIGRADTTTPIGTVHHYGGLRSEDGEALLRTTKLQVMSYGKPTPVRHKWALFGRTAEHGRA